MKDENGIPYSQNQVLINIEKAKPKGVSTRGTISLFFDWKKNRYYEQGEYKDLYAFDHENQKNHFREPLAESKIQDKDPF
jgi:hypothetical protein